MGKVSQKGIESSKGFWNSIKPFSTNKGALGNGDITLLEKNNTICDGKWFVKKFNEYCINMLEESYGKNSIGYHYCTTSFD